MLSLSLSLPLSLSSSLSSSLASSLSSSSLLSSLSLSLSPLLFCCCSDYDIVLDCCDNPYTRYLLSDACCIMDKPLVSGSAMGFEGQLTVYNLNGGPCYRCLYPKVSKADACKSCSDNGVLGPVPGMIGTLQATEVRGWDEYSRASY